jgi:cell wall-associated NlpC family hydrolase
MKLPFSLYGDLLTVPYRYRGRSARTGLDCVGVFSIMQRRLGKSVPFYPSHEGGLAAARGQWVKVAKPEIGDAILMFSDDPPWHVATAISAVEMIHAKSTAGVVIERFDSPLFARRIEGFYRWKEQASGQ